MWKTKKSIAIILGILILAAASVTTGYMIQVRNSEKQSKSVSTYKEMKNASSQNKAEQRPESAVNKENIEQEQPAKSLVREFKDEPLKHNDKGVPILYYHSIDYEKGNELRLPKEKFREQMQYLKDNNYTTLTLSELYEFIQNNKPIPEKSVVITFDDGYEDNYTNAFPILKEFGFKAAVFMISCNVDSTQFKVLKSTELKEMEENGVEIESHTVNHDKLSELDYNNQLKTLKDSKEFLGKVLNKKIDYICYPYGMFNKDTIKASKEAGYIMGFTTVGGWADKNDGIYTLNRVYVSAFDSMEKFKRSLASSNYDRK